MNVIHCFVQQWSMANTAVTSGSVLTKDVGGQREPCLLRDLCGKQERVVPDRPVQGAASDCWLEVGKLKRSLGYRQMSPG